MLRNGCSRTLAFGFSLSGIMSTQVVIYIKMYPKDPRAIKILVSLNIPPPMKASSPFPFTGWCDMVSRKTLALLRAECIDIGSPEAAGFVPFILDLRVDLDQSDPQFRGGGEGRLRPLDFTSSSSPCTAIFLDTEASPDDDRADSNSACHLSNRP
jgi:hypothetical protein